jgi:DNA-binding CsgD family transcriptional regulator
MASRGLLSDRERQCLELVARGQRSGSIAGELAIAVVTVEAHLKSARRKLEAKTMPHAVARAICLREIGPAGDLSACA